MVAAHKNPAKTPADWQREMAFMFEHHLGCDPPANCALKSCNLFFPSAADVRNGAMDLAHPCGGFGTFIFRGRVDQRQPITEASAGRVN